MKPQMPPRFCASATTCSASVVLPEQFRPVNLDDAAARQAADAERDVEAERAGGDRLDLDRLLVLAEPHDRALAAIPLDLRDRRLQRLLFIHLQLLRRGAARHSTWRLSLISQARSRVANGWLRRTLPRECHAALVGLGREEKMRVAKSENCTRFVLPSQCSFYVPHSVAETNGPPREPWVRKIRRVGR